MVKTNTQKRGPNWRPESWVQMEPLWVKIADVYEALATIDLKGAYLTQALGEFDESYQTRVELSSMGQDLLETVTSNAGLLLDFSFEDDTPTELVEDATSVDSDGNSFKSFLGKVICALLKDECVLLGCHIAAREERGSDMPLPYFSCISIPQSVYAPLMQRTWNDATRKMQNGLVRIAIKSSEEVPSTDPNDFSVEIEDIYHVYSLRREGNNRNVVAKQKFGVVKSGERAGEFEAREEPVILNDVAGQPLQNLPFVWLSLSGEIGRPQSPPFYSMAEKLIRLFNLESELDAIQRRVNIPIPHQGHVAGVPDEPEDITLGTDVVWHHDANAPVGFVEPSGSAMGISHERINDLKAQIDRERDKFLALSPQETATAALLDAGQTRMTLETISARIESSIQELFKLYKSLSDRTYRPGDPAGGIKISLKFLQEQITSEDIKTLPLMLESGILQDVYTARAKALQLGYLTPDLIQKAEELRSQASEDEDTLLLRQPLNLNGNSSEPVILG